ncbi:hypothetical protein D9M68_950930 [compost metagenome]
MAVERAVFAFAGLQQQRQVAGLQAPFAGSDQSGQTGFGDQPQHFGGIVLAEGAGQVHVGILSMGGPPGLLRRTPARQTQSRKTLR